MNDKNRLVLAATAISFLCVISSQAQATSVDNIKAVMEACNSASQHLRKSARTLKSPDCRSIRLPKDTSSPMVENFTFFHDEAGYDPSWASLSKYLPYVGPAGSNCIVAVKFKKPSCKLTWNQDKQEATIIGKIESATITLGKTKEKK